MHTAARSTITPVIVTLVAVALLATRGDPPPAAVDDSRDQEVLRIRAHLATVEAELLAADVAQLTPAQRAARARHIAVLREYRQAGVFPHNHTVADRHVPVFVDEHGTHCAVGYLLARDGRPDVVERVRSTRNNVTVPQLADDPELVAWLAEAGLALEEAARIQPMYGPSGPPPVVANDHTYRNATFLATGLGVGMSVWNLSVAGIAAERSLPGALGAGVGIAEIALGAVGLIGRAAGSENTRREVGAAYVAVNFGAGVVTTALGLRNLLRGESEPPRTIGAGSASRQGVQWQLSPWAPAMDGGAGLRLDVRF